MSDKIHLLPDLLKDDCLADGRHYEMLFSGARTEGNGGGVGETSPDNAVEVWPDCEVGRSFSATGVIDATSSLIGGLGWDAKAMILRPVNVCSTTRNDSGSPRDRAHPGAEPCGQTPSRPARVQSGTRVFADARHGRGHLHRQRLYNPEQPA
jgi:hypothetical protein